MSVMAITLHQPYASLVACGAKRVETRGWPPADGWMGTLLIHAGLSVEGGTTKAHEAAYEERCMREPYLSVLIAAGFGGPEDLPRGKVIAVAQVMRVAEMTEESIAKLRKAKPTEHEFGNYEPGRFAWVLDGVKQLREPIPCTGHQKLWRPPPGVIEAARAQVT